MSAYTLELAWSLYPWGTGHARGSAGTPGGRGAQETCVVSTFPALPGQPAAQDPQGERWQAWHSVLECRALRESRGSNGSLSIMTAQCTVIDPRTALSSRSCSAWLMWCGTDLENPAPPGATNPQVSSVSLKTKLFYSPRGIEQFLHKPSTSGASEEREGTLQHMCLFVWSAHCWVFY